MGGSIVFKKVKVAILGNLHFIKPSWIRKSSKITICLKSEANPFDETPRLCQQRGLIFQIGVPMKQHWWVVAKHPRAMCQY